MRPSEKQKILSYNDSSYYRANPYAHQNFIPTSSLKNRKQLDYPTQIPQGIQYFDSSHRKMFISLANKSAINENQIFSNPEKFPFQNRLALDKNYYRSLNIIDIEGASANSKMSEALRNKVKAQQQLQRRKNSDIQQMNQGKLFMQSEQQQRRKLAEDQVNKLNSRQKDLGSKKMQKNYNSQKNLMNGYKLKKYGYAQIGIQVEDSINQKINIFKQDGNVKKSQFKEQHVELFNPNIIQHSSNKQKQQQISMKKQEFEENIKNYLNPKQPTNTDKNDDILPSSSRESKSDLQTNDADLLSLYYKDKKNIQEEIKSHRLREQVRRINPTNLSYEGSSIKNSRIFANLGKNLIVKN